MNKKFKPVLLLLLILILAVSLAGCNPNGNGGGDTPPDNGGPKESINKPVLLETISNALDSQRKANNNAEVLNVTSQYTIIVHGINYQFDYQANYMKNRDRDSEIYLRIFDCKWNENIVLVYYNGDDLYLQLDGQYVKYEDFGSTSFFDTFFALVTKFDFNELLVSEGFKDTLDTLITLGDSRKINSQKVAGNRQYVEIKDIPLDSKKENINAAIASTLGIFENKFDLLSMRYLDVNLSDLAKLEVSTINGKLLTVAIKDNQVNDIFFKLDGKLSNNIDEYTLDFRLATTARRKEIALAEIDDPALIDYQVGNLSSLHYAGTFEIPLLDILYDTDIKMDLNATNNATNKLFISFTESGVNQGSAFYKDGVFYIDVSGVYNRLGGSVDLDYLNLPKIKKEDIDLAEEIEKVMSHLLKIIEDMATGEWGANDPNIQTGSGGTQQIPSEESAGEEDKGGIFSTIVSRMQTTRDTITIYIDKELLSLITSEEDVDIMKIVGDFLGLSEEVLNFVFGDIDLEDTTISLSYNIDTQEITIALVAEDIVLLRFRLYQQEVVREDFVIEYPQDFDPSHYKEILQPDEIQYNLKGTISAVGQGASVGVDLSTLWGALIGDITGVNTPYTLRSYQVLGIEISGSEVGGNQFTCTIKDITHNQDDFNHPDNTKIISIYAPLGDFLYIDFYRYDMSYAIQKSAVIESLQALADGGDAFAEGSISQLFNTIMKNATTIIKEDGIVIALNPHGKKDPLKDLLGIGNLSMQLIANISFEAETVAVVEANYPIPTLIIDDGLVIEFESMYEVIWLDEVDVRFGEAEKAFQLSFIGESAKFKHGVYLYKPEAKLFGGIVSYTMLINDTQYGTKEISELDLDSGLIIDPADAQPLPAKIPVIYEDGTKGSIEYEIEGLALHDIQITGMPLTYYNIIIGKGSIGERTFRTQIEVLNRVIYPLNIEDNIRNNVPIVKEIVIDPYYYALRNLEGEGTYNPIYETALEIVFGSQYTSNDRNVETIDDFEWDIDANATGWDFTLDAIDFNGGRYYVKGRYKTLEIGLVVIVRAKRAESIQIQGEEAGKYTVDSLIHASYAIPNYSTPDKEIRLYFEDGTYRIIGEPEDYQKVFDRGYNPNGDPNFDGYWPFPFNWDHPVVDNLVDTQSQNEPFKGAGSTTKAVFGIENGEYYFSIGNQLDLSIHVDVPSRQVGTAGSQIQAVVHYEIQNSEIVRIDIDGVWVSRAAFPGFPLQGAYDFDPYDTSPIPSFVEIDAEYAGVVSRRSYPIVWQASSLLSEDGRILHPNNEEIYFKVVGNIGDGPIKQEIILLVKNLAAQYTSIKINGLPENVLTLNVDPYAPLALPESFTLTFGDGKNHTFAANWKMEVNGELVSIDNDIKFVATGTSYKPQIEIVTFVEKADGILEQSVYLTLNILRRTVAQGKIGGIVPGEIENIVIDTYQTSAKALYDKIVEGIDKIDVFMTDISEPYKDLPVTWSNISELKDMLTSPLASSITLEGYIFKDKENEQKVTCTFNILPRVVEGIEFVRIVDNPDLITVDFNLQNKLIQINLHRVFALADPETGRNTLPYAYLKDVLSEVSIRFANGEFGTFSPVFNLGTEEEFNAQIFNNEVDITICAFLITKLSAGSNLDSFTLNVQTKQDQPLTPTFYENIVLFGPNGDFLYPTGYPITGELEVAYKHSGNIRYIDIEWLARSQIGNIPAGQHVTNIPLTDVKMNVGQSYYLITALPNGQQLQMVLAFQKADIQDTYYNATAEDTLYNIVAGNIVINNIYSYKQFDVSKLPTQIKPIPSPSFFINDQIVFDISWTILVENLDKIGAAGCAKTKIAEATIQGFGDDFQTISLYLTVNELANAEYNIPQVIAVSHPEPGANHIYIDPYVDNFSGNFVLPENIIMTFNSGSQSINMLKAANNFHYEWNGAPITAIPYNHLGHILQDEPENDVQIILVLSDGNEVIIDLFFQDRTLSEIFIPNKVTVSEEVEGEYSEGDKRYVNLNRIYYIDPYDEDTHTVPNRISACFEQGDNIYITVEWIPSNDFEITYQGGEYVFYSSLEGYGEGLDPQMFYITVVVLDRSLRTTYYATHHFDDPIGGMVSDIANELQASAFVDLPQEYLVFGLPVLPAIKWNIDNNEITAQGMLSTQKTGNFTNNGFVGEEVYVTISVSKWSFKGVFLDEEGTSPLPNNRFRFNAFSEDTVSEYFFMKFEIADSGSYTYVKFYSQKRELDDIQKRHTIFWDDAVDLSFAVQIGKIELSNAFKTQRIVSQGYGYVYAQIVITALDLGYDNGGAITPKYVVDPLNPIFPATAEAYYSGGSLGKIPVEWSANVHDVIFDGGQTDATITLYPFENTPQVVNVTVYYLDRTPIRYSTSLPNYSTVSDQDNPGFYLLPNLTGNINPINLTIFDAELGEYILPVSLRVGFRNYTSGTDAPYMVSAIQKYKAMLDLIDIAWNLGENVITLQGTPAGSPLNIAIASYKVSTQVEIGQTVVSDRVNSASELLSVKFNVLNKDIISTTISSTNNVHLAAAQYSIDPYNVSFPTSIGVRYRDEFQDRVYDNLVWSYNRSLLTNPLFINGSYGEESMYINATIELFAQTFNIDFKVMPRHIDVLNPQGQVTPINGGTIYVLKGLALRPQLPTSIYYLFANPFDSNDTSWQLIPLVFNALDLDTINTNKAGSYPNIGARMGIEYDLDIVYFNIEVVDPVLRYYDEQLYVQGSSVYDYITIAVTQGGVYMPGKEVALTPKQLALSANKTISITTVSYDFANNQAVLTCNYPISGASPSLGGTILANRSFTLTFRVPLRTYQFTYLDAPPALTETTITHEIGTPLTQSTLPQAELNGIYYPLMWDMSSVNIRRAGTYVIFGYYKNAFNEDSALALTVIIEKLNISSENVRVSPEWREREFTGEEVPPIIDVDTFLREDGSYRNIDYLIQYSINGTTWFVEQPTATTPANSFYFLRLSFNDYNVQGEVVYTFRINKKVIKERDIGFVNELTGNNLLTYNFSGATFSPIVTGLPEDCLYNVKYTKEGIETSLYDAGTYSLLVTIPEQLNYASELLGGFYATVTINKAIVNYAIAGQVTYNSTYQHCKIAGLPEILPADMSVEYLYSYGTVVNSPNPIRNVGTYYVAVKINGGNNYPSNDALGGQFSIVRKDLVISAGIVEVDYLQEFDVNFIRDKVEYQGLQVNDRKSDLGNLIVSTPATSKSIIGDYPITFSGLSHPNYAITYIPSTLRIAPSTIGQSQVIHNRAELLSAIDALDDTASSPQITWYLAAGNYGDIVLNKNAAIIMIGAYSLEEGEYVIGTTFDSIKVSKGTLTLDIARLYAKSNATSLTIGAGMSGIKISRSEFVNNTGAAYANAIVTDVAFKGEVQLESTLVKGYSLGVYMPGGSIKVEKSTFEENDQAIRIMNGEIECSDSSFLRNINYGIYIAYQHANLVLSGNTFMGNKYAVASIEDDLLDPSKGYLVRNVFKSNAKNLLKLN